MNQHRTPRFSIIHDDDETILAYFNCWSIVNGEEDDEYQFMLSDIQWMPCAYKASSIIGNIRLGILNYTGNKIGEYFVHLQQRTKWRDLGKQEWMIDTVMNEEICMEELDMWDLLRDDRRISSGMWLTFSQHRREMWLKLVRYHSSYNDLHTDKLIYESKEPHSFKLDMHHVRDRVSFFLLLGECLNGPAGYYGIGLDSLKDCLYGGFGTVVPFTLQILHAPNKNKTLQDPFIKEFLQLIDLMQNSGVEVIV
ncbi:hypothetical protein [Paenibacillus sp. WLX2291]|uniref:barstar family protein n=1 Tax=Paenibacillus sp. WLX2291 TaxID=3296934 RepID=UPI00398413FD